MKKILLIKFIILMLLISAPYLITKNIYSRVSTTQMSPLSAAKAQAFNKVDKYLASATEADRNKLVKYLGFYRSWYQAVTPAPQDLYNQLSRKAKKLAASIKEIAKEFTIQSKSLIGSSKLTKDGVTFYTEVINRLQNGQVNKTQAIKNPLRTFNRR